MGAIPNQHIFQTSYKPSLNLCALFCNAEDSCMSFAYNEMTQDCSLSNVDLSRESIQIDAYAGTRLYAIDFPSR